MNLPGGVHELRVPIPDNPLGFLLSYVLVGRDGNTLIDTGWNVPEAYQSVVDQLRELGLRVEDVRQIILTHMHPDHSGLANQIRRASGAKVLAHKLEAPIYQKGKWGGPLDAYGVPQEIRENTRFTQPSKNRHDWPEPDTFLEGGEVIDAGNTRLEVIWTPGHAPGHICLYDRKNRILFSGDHVLPITTPHVSIRFSRDEHLDPLGDYLSSLEKVKPLEVDVVLPAHEHIFNDLTARLKEIEFHHEERLQEMRNSAGAGWVSPFEVAKHVTWAIGPFHSLDNSYKVMAVAETLAHLEFMTRRGQMAKKDEAGIILYRMGC